MANGHGGPRPGSGRKAGIVSKAKMDIAERAKSHGDTALAVLVEVATDLEAPHSARVSAANALLDRGYGKPMQAVEMTGADGGPIKHEEVARDADAFTRRISGLAAGVVGAGDGAADAGPEGGT